MPLRRGSLRTAKTTYIPGMPRDSKPKKRDNQRRGARDSKVTRQAASQQPLHNFGLDGDVESNPGPTKVKRAEKTARRAVDVAHKLERETKREVDQLRSKVKRVEREVSRPSTSLVKWRGPSSQRYAHPEVRRLLSATHAGWPHPTALNYVSDPSVDLGAVRHPTSAMPKEVRGFAVRGVFVVNVAVGDFVVIAVNRSQLGTDIIPINAGLPANNQPPPMAPFLMWTGTAAQYGTPFDQLTPVVAALTGTTPSTADGAGEGECRMLAGKIDVLTMATAFNQGGAVYTIDHGLSVFGWQTLTQVPATNLTAPSLNALIESEYVATESFGRQAHIPIVPRDVDFHPILTYTASLASDGAAVDMSVIDESALPKRIGAPAPNGWDFATVIVPPTTAVATTLRIHVEAQMEEVRMSSALAIAGSGLSLSSTQVPTRTVYAHPNAAAAINNAALKIDRLMIASGLSSDDIFRGVKNLGRIGWGGITGGPMGALAEMGAILGSNGGRPNTTGWAGPGN